jgi:hypothetical protein
VSLLSTYPQACSSALLHVVSAIIRITGMMTLRLYSYRYVEKKHILALFPAGNLFLAAKPCINYCQLVFLVLLKFLPLLSGETMRFYLHTVLPTTDSTVHDAWHAHGIDLIHSIPSRPARTTVHSFRHDLETPLGRMIRGWGYDMPVKSNVETTTTHFSGAIAIPTRLQMRMRGTMIFPSSYSWVQYLHSKYIWNPIDRTEPQGKDDFTVLDVQ